MSYLAIKTERLGKRYRIGQAQSASYKTLRENISKAMIAPFRGMSQMINGQIRKNGRKTNGNGRQFWALKDVSLEICQGEVVGIIGRNGAGKSTLLKILSCITEPTEGAASVCGRVGSLLEVGTGFHPELTGEENIYLNGAILGMQRREIRQKFDEIVAFAEVERFIDTQVKHYSSGMYLRLAFAVAAHLEPEILFVDEVLAVGDAAFQKKCLGKMEDVAHQGRTVLFVSHNLAVMSRLCTHAYWIDQGRLKLSGDATSVVGAYLSSDTATESTWENPVSDPAGDEPLIHSASVTTVDGQPARIVDFQNPFKVQVKFEIPVAIRNVPILIRLSDFQGNLIWTSWDLDSVEADLHLRETGHYCSSCTIPGGLLKPGSYYLSLGTCIPGVKYLSFHENALTFEVSQVGYPFDPKRFGILTPTLDWQTTKVTG